MFQLTFMGAVGTVTGSKYLVEAAGRRVLVDCGLYQGYKQLRLRNWERPPVDPASLDAVILTHAHIDHSGYLPLLVRNGFSGPVLATSATADLCGLLLPDSGYLLEKDADFANRHGFSKHHPALPLYTQAEANYALDFFKPQPFHKLHDLGNGLKLQFLPAGHIPGAAMVRLTLGKTSLHFTGDLGRPGDPLMVAPESVSSADYLVVESTYGNRIHDPVDPVDMIADIVNRTLHRGGVVVIPSFAVGRAQSLLYYLYTLMQSGQIPKIPVFLDSPMSIKASELFCKHHGEARLSEAECRHLCDVARYVESVEESKSLLSMSMPRIIISASGMATGGRILHHLKAFAGDRKNTILFAGFQASGTRGARIVGGEKEIKIHGAYIPVLAEVHNLEMLSAHADCVEIMDWLSGFKKPPRRTFITHGEPAAADGLRRCIEEDLGWSCRVPSLGEKATLE
ncbi:MAG: MBL fold metallo-hydrolase [Rhodospirillaceae bacterium]|nr:MBL fold metallo-hydrolase [Rhodospirillaceae bacterium]